jgi:hypothetical protein
MAVLRGKYRCSANDSAFLLQEENSTALLKYARRVFKKPEISRL